jgi:hypothetical protein
MNDVIVYLLLVHVSNSMVRIGAGIEPQFGWLVGTHERREYHASL